MAGEAQDQNWPLPKFYFVAHFGSIDNAVSFQEISGLDPEAQRIEYRSSNSKIFSSPKMPGLTKTGIVTLKRGLFVNDQLFLNWHSSILMNTIKRETVTIQLLDEGANPTMTWTLANAWPTKITVTDMKSAANEVAVETLELAHEGLTITNGL